jgi:hypothetical protein
LGITVNIRIVIIMGVRIVKFTTTKNLVVKSKVFPHQNIHKNIWTSPDGKTGNQIDHILRDRRCH